MLKFLNISLIQNLKIITKLLEKVKGQGIAKRALDGTAASAQAAQAGAGARQLATLGWQFAQAA